MDTIKTFRKCNKISQVALAEYLKVTQGFISQMENGTSAIPDVVISRILENPFGWDTSMLVESEPEPAQVTAQSDDYVKDRLFALLDDQSEQIKMLLGMLKEKDEEIRQLREELDERKRGTAPVVGTSSSAKAV